MPAELTEGARVDRPRVDLPRADPPPAEARDLGPYQSRAHRARYLMVLGGLVLAALVRPAARALLARGAGPA